MINGKEEIKKKLSNLKKERTKLKYKLKETNKEIGELREKLFALDLKYLKVIGGK